MKRFRDRPWKRKEQKYHANASLLRAPRGTHEPSMMIGDIKVRLVTVNMWSLKRQQNAKNFAVWVTLPKEMNINAIRLQLRKIFPKFKCDGDEQTK